MPDEETTTRSGGRPDLDGEADDPWSRKEAARTIRDANTHQVDGNAMSA
jgi:hypothetical protein